MRSGQRLELAIDDTAAASPSDTPSDAIIDIRARLAELYGDDARLSLREGATAVEIVLSLPFQPTS